MAGYMRELFDQIKSGASLEVVLECGGDERIIGFKLGDKPIQWNSDVGRTLLNKLIEQFDLPGAGSYYVDGTGTFSIDGTKLVMTYSFRNHGFIWDPKTNTESRMDEEIEEGTTVIYDLADD